MLPLSESLTLFKPEIYLATAGILSLVLGAWRGTRGWCGAIIAFGIAAAAALLCAMGRPPVSVAIFDDMLRFDGLAYYAKWLILATLALTALMSWGARELDEVEQGEYYGLLAIAAVGLMMLAAANHLLMVVLAMETVSLCSYLLVG